MTLVEVSKLKVPVLHLAMSLDIGGAETHIVALSRSLSQMGWPVCVASFGGRRVVDLELSNIPHIKVPLHSRSPVNLIRSQNAVSQIIDDFGIGLVHAHARIPAWIADIVCRKKRVPLVTTYHGTFVSGVFWNLVTKPGDLTIAVSQDIKQYVVEKFRFDPEKIVVIPNGIDTDLYTLPSQNCTDKAKLSLGIPSGHWPVLVYASRMDKILSRTAIAVIDAAASLLDSYPQLILVVAGDGDYLGDVQKKAAQINETSGRTVVMCPGFLLDTVPLYAASDLVLGISRVVLEAMSTGRPVIMAGPEGTFGPVNESVVASLETRNFTSRGAPQPATPKILASQINKLLSDKAQMNQLGLFGRQIVQDAHSMALVAGEVEKVYAKALAASFIK